MKTNVWTIILFFFFSGCTDEGTLWLQRAETCMESDPSCAYQCLQQVQFMDGLSDASRAKYALLKVQAMHKCRMPLLNDSLINIAVAYFQKNGDRHCLAKSQLYKGVVHKQCNEVELAVEAFAASELSFQGVEDDQYKALLFDHYGMLLLKQNMYEEALRYFKRTMEYELRGDSVHYVVSTYRRMAMVYDVMGYKDSARICYEEGLSFATEKGIQSQNYHLLLQNYASFLTEEGAYAEAECLLKQCAEQMTDSACIYTVYSAFTTLYYEKGEYAMALDYADKVLDSKDSLIVCAGFLRLYKIYRDMGDLETAVHYHDLYRTYDNELSMRRKTAQVAALPHQVENRLLKQENYAWQLQQWIWILSSIIVLLVVWVLFYLLYKRYRKVQQDSAIQLEDIERTLADTEQQLGEASTNLGGLKGVITNQSNALYHLREEQRRVKEEHKDEIKRLRDSIKELEASIRTLKEEGRTLKQNEKEHKQKQKQLERELKICTDKLALVVHQREIDRRLNSFVQTGCDAVTVDMLLRFRYGEEVQARYDIRSSEYLPLLRNLLEQENPSLAEKLEKCELERNKLTMCYLMALGLDDVEMMVRAACLSVNSVKAYRRECRGLVEGLLRGDAEKTPASV